MEEIHIYHTNDLHSHFEHWPRIHELLINRRKWHTEVGEDVFMFDIGDHMDRWHPLSDGTRGKGNTSLLNKAGYDAATIGNNEGITLPFEDLNTLYDDANFQVLVANLYTEDGKHPQWVKPYSIYKTKSGIKLGVIGLTAYFSHFYHLLGWRLTNPQEELAAQLKNLKEKSDIIILLSHLGINEDEQIAEQFPEIDVILGAHTHHILHEGKLIKNSLLGAAGKFGMYVGHVRLQVDPIKKQLIHKTAILYDSNKLPFLENEKMMISDLYENGKSLLSKEIAKVPEEIKNKHNMAVMLCSALMEWCEADCAFLNKGLILKDLEKDVVTPYDLLSLCPHPINPCVVELSGVELKEVLTQTLNEKWADLQLKGLGFRGTVMGSIVYAGITIFKGSKGLNIKINNEDLIKEKIYRLAIPDMFTFGRFFPEIHRAKHKRYYLPEFLRDLIEWKLTADKDCS